MKNGRRAQPAPAPPSHEDVALRAYQLFLERGAQDGSDVADWLEAERQLTEAATSQPRLVRSRSREAKPESATAAA